MAGLPATLSNNMCIRRIYFNFHVGPAISNRFCSSFDMAFFTFSWITQNDPETVCCAAMIKQSTHG